MADTVRLVNDDYASSTKQDSIISELQTIDASVQALNDDVQYDESISVSTSTIETTTARNANNYSKYALIVNSPNSTTRFLVQWSADNSNWYHVDFYSTVASTNDVDGTTGAQNNGTQNGTVLAKFIRVRLYDDTASGTVKVLLNLLH